ncbi:MAG: SEC-C domain-containing protein [Planctomycetia bacterium]|nr:SEC-C domain-containing protein [Planctomycetia bacterium]
MSDGGGAWWVATHIPSESKFDRETGNIPPPEDPCPCGSGKKFKHCCWPKYRSTRASLLRHLAFALAIFIVFALLIRLFWDH